ncbi:MAG: leucine-rich repeat domain-containing protein, partial [bacterium]|nr:leucine-rich repeat domain-containing protein [bacterium]
MAKPSNKKLLKQLEQAIGKKLQRLERSDITLHGKTGFVLNTGGHMTCLNLARIPLDAETLRCLSGFKHLEILMLTGTGLRTLSPLQGLTNLTILRFDRNQVTDLSPLQGLTNLTILDARKNA